MEPGSPRPSLVALIDRFQPEGTAEAADIQRVRALLKVAADPYRRDLPLHVTASALIVHPPTGRVMLRWHQRQQAWLQVGGHGDPGETDPLAIVAREAEEETGLTDLVPWPDAEIKQVVIVDVPPGKGEPAHQHADVRFFMATGTPDAIRAENAQAQLRWLTLPAARDTTSEPNLREALTRIEPFLGHLRGHSRTKHLHPRRRGGFLHVYPEACIARQIWIVPDDGFVDECRRNDAKARPVGVHRFLEERGLYQPGGDDDRLAGEPDAVGSNWPHVDGDPQPDLRGIVVSAIVIIQGRECSSRRSVGARAAPRPAAKRWVRDPLGVGPSVPGSGLLPPTVTDLSSGP